MRSHTALIAVGLLVLAVAVRLAGPDADRADRETSAAVREVRDPRAASPPGRADFRRWWDDCGWLLSALGLAAVAVAAECATRLTQRNDP